MTNRIRRWVFWPSVLGLRAITWLWFRVKVRGKRNYPDSPYVAVVNHASNLDLPVLAWAVERPLYFLAKAELFAVPVLGWWLRAIGGIPVRRGERDRTAFEHALIRLREGHPVFIAPEGTRKHAGDGSARPHTGFVRLAQMAGCPVVPIGVAGTRRAMPPGARWPRPRRLQIRVGEPLRLPTLEVRAANRAALQAQADAVMARVYELRGGAEAP